MIHACGSVLMVGCMQLAILLPHLEQRTFPENMYMKSVQINSQIF